MGQHRGGGCVSIDARLDHRHGIGRQLECFLIGLCADSHEGLRSKRPGNPETKEAEPTDGGIRNLTDQQLNRLQNNVALREIVSALEGDELEPVNVFPP